MVEGKEKGFEEPYYGGRKPIANVLQPIDTGGTNKKLTIAFHEGRRSRVLVIPARWGRTS